MKKKITIIGSGFGGLGAANRLASIGHDVTILEKRDKLGGRAYVYEKNGFKFDGGPTVITAPFMFDEIFEKAGKKREDYVKFVPCNPFYRIFDHKGKHLDYNGDEKFILEQIDNWNPKDKQGYIDFIKTTKAIFDKGFTEPDPREDLGGNDVARKLLILARVPSSATHTHSAIPVTKNRKQPNQLLFSYPVGPSIQPTASIKHKSVNPILIILSRLSKKFIHICKHNIVSICFI